MFCGTYIIVIVISKAIIAVYTNLYYIFNTNDEILSISMTNLTASRRLVQIDPETTEHTRWHCIDLCP